MYPKMRPDTYFEKSTGGVSLVRGGHTTRIEGHKTYDLLEYLSRVCDGQHSLEAVLERFPPVRAANVRHLLARLTEAGIFRDAEVDRAAPLPPALLQRYAPTLTFLETLVDDPHQRFERLRERPVYIVGDGSALRTLAPALWEAGLRCGEVHLMSLKHAPGLRRRFAAHVQEDAASDWTISAHPAVSFDWRRPPALVIGCGQIDDVLRWQAQSVQAGAPFFPVVYGPDCSTLGPLVNAGGARAGCAACLAQSVALSPPGRDTFTAAAFIGARAAVEVFRIVAGIGSVTRDRVLRIDGDELTDSVHRLLPMWDCPVCASRSLDLDAQPLELVDAFTGPIHACDPEDLQQLPLAMARCRTHARQTVAAGRDLAEATRRATFSALTRIRPGTGRVVAGHPRAALALGLLDYLRRTTDVVARGKRATEADLAALLTRETAPWWKTLSLLYGRTPELWRSQDAGSGAYVTLIRNRGDQQELAQSAGSTPEEALELALLDALSALQLDGQAAQERAPATPLAAVGPAAERWASWLPEHMLEFLTLELDDHGVQWPSLGLVVGQVSVRSLSRRSVGEGRYAAPA